MSTAGSGNDKEFPFTFHVPPDLPQSMLSSTDQDRQIGLIYVLEATIGKEGLYTPE